VFAKKINNGRSEFLKSLGSQAAFVQEIAKKFGQDYDSRAHYFDVYETNTPLIGRFTGPILSHEESNDKWCTLRVDTKYRVGNEVRNLPTDVKIKVRNTTTNQVQEKPGYFAYFYLLPEGSYEVSISHDAFETAIATMPVKYSASPFFRSTQIALETRIANNRTTGVRRKQLWGGADPTTSAQWFDFETGQGEYARIGFAPPSETYDVWIEPQDPEIGSVRSTYKDIVYVGNLPLANITQAPASGYIEGYHPSMGQPPKVGDVYVVKTREGNFAAVKVITTDRAKQLMEFDYKLTTRPDGRFN